MKEGKRERERERKSERDREVEVVREEIERKIYLHYEDNLARVVYIY